MNISIPDTLTVDTSDHYIMSIRLRSGGLSFSAYDPAASGSYFFRDVAFDKQMPYTTSLKELFFANECLVWPYKGATILYVSPLYTVAPGGMLLEEEGGMPYLSFIQASPEKRCLRNPAGGGTDVIFGMGEEIYEFCSRSLINPRFVHHVTPELSVLAEQSRGEGIRRMNVFIHRRFIDISCFSEGRLLFVNSFLYEQYEDILYYILYVWKQTEMSQLADKLSLAGPTDVCQKLVQSLQVYIHDIGRVEVPSEAYLLGGEILQSPMDLVFWTVCES